MKALIRIMVVVIGLVLLLVTGAFVYLRFVFDPNDFRARLGEEVRKATGRELTIDGDLELSVFPWLGVRIGAARLGNAPGFPAQDFARIRAAQVRALLMPLLSGRVEVDRVVLEGLELNLEVDRQGLGNWADLAAAGKPGQAGAGQETARSAPPALVLGGLTLTDASLRWHDLGSGARYELDDLELEAGRLAPGEPLPLRLAARLASAQPAVTARLTVETTAQLDLAAQRYRLEALALAVDAQGAGLPGGAAKLSLRAEVTADLAAGTAQLKGLMLESYGLELSGELAVSALDSAPQVAGTVALAEFDPRRLAAAFGSPLPTPADATALQRLSLAGRIAASAGHARLDGLVVQLDATRLEGHVAIQDFAGPQVAFELAIDGIDVDRYLPAGPGAGASPPAGEGSAAASQDRQGPLIPSALMVDGALRIGQFKAAGLSLADISLPVTVKAGQARLKPSASLYEGRYQGNIGIDGRKREPRMTLDERLDGVRVAPLTRDLTGQEARLSGTANVVAVLQLQGAGGDEIRRSLTGEARLNFANGALKGVNVAAFMRQAEAVLTGQSAPPESGPNETDFTDLNATVRFAEGVARNDDLVLRSPLLRVHGEGQARLVEESLDYLVRASVVGTLTGQGGKPLTRVKGVTVPIRVSGHFSEPKYALDTQALVKDNLEQKFEEKKQEVRKKAEDKLKQELQKGLQNLLR